MKFRIRFLKKRPVFAYVCNCLNDSVKALLIAWNSKVFALAGRVEPTCETSVNHVFLTSNPQPIGFRGNLLVKRQKFFYCTYSLGITETS